MTTADLEGMVNDLDTDTTLGVQTAASLLSIYDKSHTAAPLVCCYTKNKQLGRHKLSVCLW